jgi:hypothetical protein
VWRGAYRGRWAVTCQDTLIASAAIVSRLLLLVMMLTATFAVNVKPLNVLRTVSVTNVTTTLIVRKLTKARNVVTPGFRNMGRIDMSRLDNLTVGVYCDPSEQVSVMDQDEQGWYCRTCDWAERPSHSVGVSEPLAGHSMFLSNGWNDSLSHERETVGEVLGDGEALTLRRRARTQQGAV